MNPQETSQRQSLFIPDKKFGSVQWRLKTRSFLWTSVLSLIVLLSLPSGSFAQSPLTDDANTSTAPKATDTNFGTNPNLNVSATGNVYIKFKLSSTLPVNTGSPLYPHNISWGRVRGRNVEPLHLDLIGVKSQD